MYVVTIVCGREGFYLDSFFLLVLYSETQVSLILLNGEGEISHSYK